MKIIFYGGRQVGMISLLTLRSLGHKVVYVIPQDDIVTTTANSLNLMVHKVSNINAKDEVSFLKNLKADLFICCYGRQIIKPALLKLYPAINLHPCLYRYNGAHPIERVLADNEKRISVGVHWMIERVDQGKVIVELFKERESSTVEGVYNELYPLFSQALIAALKTIRI